MGGDPYSQSVEEISRNEQQATGETVGMPLRSSCLFVSEGNNISHGRFGQGPVESQGLTKRPARVFEEHGTSRLREDGTS